MKEFIYAIVAYLIGSIPSGYIIARWSGIKDIRKHGSGNIGATNVARVMGIKYFFIVLFFDALKAFLCIFFGYLIGCEKYIINVFSILLLVGNSYSLFLNFTGGKGIGTAIGMLLAFSIPLSMAFISIWLVIFFITFTAGLSSVLALLFLPYVGYYIADDTLIIQLFITIWCLFQHSDNIKKFF